MLQQNAINNAIKFYVESFFPVSYSPRRRKREQVLKIDCWAIDARQDMFCYVLTYRTFSDDVCASIYAEIEGKIFIMILIGK